MYNVGALLESLPTSGVMTSPNFPGNYPDSVHERRTIEVAKGNLINIHFTDFEVEPAELDYVHITDGDGTFLGLFWNKDGISNRGSCKDGGVSNITSVTETVQILFHTDMSGTRSGWRLEWSKQRILVDAVINLVSRFISITGNGKRASNVWCPHLPQLPVRIPQRPRPRPENPGS